MTETERADRIARGPRRRFVQNIVMIAALLLALAAFVVATHEAQQRAQSAETSALSLAQQVQAACESRGSLRVDGRDLCEQADDVVDGVPQAAGPAGAQGMQGAQGERGFTGAQGIQGRTGPPGEVGPRGPLGPRGEAGMDGTDGVDGTDGADGEPGATGPQGEPGPQGAQGSPGADGADGRGIAKIECLDTGDWIFTYTDGTATTVEGPCRAIAPTPSPTATTTKGQ